MEAISPRPEGTYQFSIRMKADEPMSVTIEALGTWEIFSVTTAWQQYDILISEQAGDYIDLYPLSDAVLYVEKMQLTYGAAEYDWRPAPEDDVQYEWTNVALDKVAVTSIRDIVNYQEYYCALPAGSPVPAVPTTYPPPAPWTETSSIAGAYRATASVTGSITDAVVDASVFGRKVGGGAGVYSIAYDGASWRYEGDVILLQEYGINVAGTPSAGDTVSVTLHIDTAMTVYRSAVTVFSDGSFNWSTVAPAEGYDAAMAAINTSTKYQTQVEQLLDSWAVKVRATTVNDDTGETVGDLLGRIQVTESNISSLIEATQRSEDGLNERITSVQMQNSREIVNAFTEAKQYADETYGPTKEYAVTAQSWQRFSAAGIEQGKLGSPFKSVLTNSELGFYENDQRVAYINNNKLMITTGEVLESLVIGNFEFTSSNNGFGIIFNGSGGS